MTNSQLDTTNDSQEVNPFPEGDHKAHINRRAEWHSKHKAEKSIKDPKKKYRLGTVGKNILLVGLNQFHGPNLTLDSDVDQDTFGKVTKHNTHDSQEVRPFPAGDHKATTNRLDTHQHEA